MEEKAENQKMIEMSNKRMRDSNVFRGKLHETKMETSYKPAVATEKQSLTKVNKTHSHLYIPKDIPQSNKSETKDKFIFNEKWQRADRSVDKRKIKSKMNPSNLFGHYKTNNNNKSEKVSTAKPADKDQIKGINDMMKDLRSSHLSLGNQKFQSAYLTKPGKRSSTSMSARPKGFSVGFNNQQSLLPKHGVFMG
eukprot:CAMPEP_0197006954 /NCGR_PEP_ID=MMETSP1380-20130617/38174_1 /TAXON_ID=5936 /ORGANISM="Euplotes crassus, Strain CT5" /LENGTH=193 /DNA_ID=CAMNT_0042426827 /DNA_START=520 /DNA_END=1097 /DNA_ORIENTATION=+